MEQFAERAHQGLWRHQKDGFYHDGRFATLLDVVNHYDTVFTLRLTTQEKNALVELPEGPLSSPRARRTKEGQE